MKHTWKVTAILVSLFLIAQVVGLVTVNSYIKVEKTATGEVIIKHEETALGKQPEIKQKSYSFIPIIFTVLLGTAILFILIRFQLKRFWKFWFFAAVMMTMAVSFGVYLHKYLAWLIAALLAILKVFRTNAFFHNLSEIFIYAGIAIIILPFMNIFSAIALLILISLYDMYAVWKSRHMITLAKFQSKTRLFAGLSLSYPKKGPITVPVKTGKMKSAILGGGDIAFPLIFASAVMENLILNKGLSKAAALLQTSLIPIIVTIALFLLFYKGKKDTFYPAMPFLALGCFVGYFIIILIGAFL